LGPVVTATARPRQQARYRGVVYGIDVIDHVTGEIVRNDYVGQTTQRGRGRENQHRDDQPWADLIVGSPRALWEGVCTDAELDEMERRFIQDVPVRPRLNWQLNEDNPHHIPKWVLVEQRHERDDREGRPRWVPPKQRTRDSLLEWGECPAPSVPRTRPPARASWRPWQQHVVGLGVAQVLLSVAGWIVLAVKGMWVPEAWWAVPAAVLAVTVWAWLGFPVRRQGRRKAVRRLKRRLR